MLVSVECLKIKVHYFQILDTYLAINWFVQSYHDIFEFWIIILSSLFRKWMLYVDI